MTIPDYTDADDQAHWAEKHDLKKNTLVRDNWGNKPAQVTKVTDLGVYFSDGSAHTHRNIASSIEKGHVEIVGQRSTK